MDYLKFNSYDIADIADDLRRIAGTGERLLDEYRSVCDSLEPQLKSYEGLAQALSVVAGQIAESCSDLRNMYRNLDSVADIYYAAQSKVTDLSEALPESASNTPYQGGRDASVPLVAAAITNTGDMLFEDWLVKLAHRTGEGYEISELR